MRIHQFLSKTGTFKTKKEALAALASGEISIGQKVVRAQHHSFNEKKESVYYKGKALTLLNKKTIAIHKPTGYICAKLTETEIRTGKKSIYELLPQSLQHLSCVGRLDEDSSGLLLMTNDGDLLHKIISSGVLKKYKVTLKFPITQEICDTLSAGVTIELEENGNIETYLTKPCIIVRQDAHQIGIELRQGKKRQIRRMLKSVGNKVISLHRTQIGTIELSKLEIGSGEFTILDSISV